MIYEHSWQPNPHLDSHTCVVNIPVPTEVPMQPLSSSTPFCFRIHEFIGSVGFKSREYARIIEVHVLRRTITSISRRMILILVRTT